jgi:hypothetical protein
VLELGVGSVAQFTRLSKTIHVREMFQFKLRKVLPWRNRLAEVMRVVAENKGR